jgi:hypothetical protein
MPKSGENKALKKGKTFKVRDDEDANFDTTYECNNEDLVDLYFEAPYEHPAGSDKFFAKCQCKVVIACGEDIDDFFGALDISFI